MAITENVLKIEGKIVHGEALIWVNGQPVDPLESQKIRNHSPDGFNWGYHGSGPAQTALAVLLAAGCSREIAELEYQYFKIDYVAGWPPGEEFEVLIDLDAWLKRRGDVSEDLL